MNKIPGHEGRTEAEDGVTTASANGFACNSVGKFHDQVQFLHVMKRHAQSGGASSSTPLTRRTKARWQSPCSREGQIQEGRHVPSGIQVRASVVGARRRQGEGREERRQKGKKRWQGRQWRRRYGCGGDRGVSLTAPPGGQARREASTAIRGSSPPP